MAYVSSTTYLLTRLPHASLYEYNGRQIELFDMNLMNYTLFFIRIWSISIFRPRLNKKLRIS